MLERQGGVVRQTKKGFIAKHPVTLKLVTWHTSPPSDGVRADRNLRTDLTRAGFTWPFPA